MKQRKRNSTTWLAVAALILILVTIMVAGIARAQDDNDNDNDNGNNSLRTVYGEVTDKADKPLHDAVIYLKNVRNLTVRTYISAQDGEYRFAGLDPNVDYEIHAEYNNLISSDHTVSSFDSRKEIHVVLKVDKEKKKGQ